MEDVAASTTKEDISPLVGVGSFGVCVNQIYDQRSTIFGQQVLVSAVKFTCMQWPVFESVF